MVTFLCEFLHAARITITTARLESTSCHSNESTEENTRQEICGPNREARLEANRGQFGRFRARTKQAIIATTTLVGKYDQDVGSWFALPCSTCQFLNLILVIVKE
jgi:hypothetical protein